MIVDFLNAVLNTGCVHTEWCSGIIRPLYKNKGPITDPENYMGITLLSSTSKLFTACLNRRLLRYVEDNILGKEQAGFRDGYSTTDHVFVLKHIIELYQSIHSAPLLTIVKRLTPLAGLFSGKNCYHKILMEICECHKKHVRSDEVVC